MHHAVDNLAAAALSRSMVTPSRGLAASVLVLVLAGCGGGSDGKTAASSPLRAGVAAVKLTPCGINPDWEGTVTSTGVWGESFTDVNGNNRWDAGEPFEDDQLNTDLDRRHRSTYDGIYLAGFGHDRLATGCHDDIWARALVLESGDTKVAIVSVDMVGEILHGRYYGFARARDMVDPALGIDAVIFSSTHDHEGPDSLGLWGESDFDDGKYPRYLQFVDRQVARAIREAAAPSAMRPVRVVAAKTTPGTQAELRGLQVRTGCRPPFFFDDELRALQFIGSDGGTVATLINWSTHPESLEDENTLVSSDFPHYVRERVEGTLGGTAVYLTGDLGAVEIVGDTCVGGADAHGDDGTNEFDSRDHLGFERTRQLGELVGDATVAALRAGERLDVAELRVGRLDYHIAGSNDVFAFANMLSLLDLDEQAFDVANCPPGTGICPPVEQYLLTLVDQRKAAVAQLVTVPGELFPELFSGVEQARRTDCPAANTGLPYEPSIRAAMTAPYRLLAGLSPDEFGYIVPGYDFYPAPSVDAEAEDPCFGQPYDARFPRRTVPRHYHESLSVGPDIAATSACYALQLLGRDSDVVANAACRRALWLP
jgi:hypothetical protein